MTPFHLSGHLWPGLRAQWPGLGVQGPKVAARWPKLVARWPDLMAHPWLGTEVKRRSGFEYQLPSQRRQPFHR